MKIISYLGFILDCRWSRGRTRHGPWPFSGGWYRNSPTSSPPNRRMQQLSDGVGQRVNALHSTTPADTSHEQEATSQGDHSWQHAIHPKALAEKGFLQGSHRIPKAGHHRHSGHTSWQWVDRSTYCWTRGNCILIKPRQTQRLCRQWRNKSKESHWVSCRKLHWENLVVTNFYMELR